MLLVERVEKHFLEMMVLRFPIYVRGIHPIIDRIKVLVLPPTVHQIPHANPFDDSVFVATILSPDQLHEPGVAFILDAIIHNQTGLLTILNPVFDQLPHVAGQEAFIVQKIVDHVVAHVLQVLSQIGARTILGRADQILDVLLLGNHNPKMLFFSLKRKS
mgnify:CR=1 FL=1